MKDILYNNFLNHWIPIEPNFNNFIRAEKQLNESVEDWHNCSIDTVELSEALGSLANIEKLINNSYISTINGEMLCKEVIEAVTVVGKAFASFLLFKRVNCDNVLFSLYDDLNNNSLLELLKSVNSSEGDYYTFIFNLYESKNKYWYLDSGNYFTYWTDFEFYINNSIECELNYGKTLDYFIFFICRCRYIMEINNTVITTIGPRDKLTCIQQKFDFQNYYDKFMYDIVRDGYFLETCATERRVELDVLQTLKDDCINLNYKISIGDELREDQKKLCIDLGKALKVCYYPDKAKITDINNYVDRIFKFVKEKLGKDRDNYEDKKNTSFYTYMRQLCKDKFLKIVIDLDEEGLIYMQNIYNLCCKYIQYTAVDFGNKSQNNKQIIKLKNPTKNISIFRRYKLIKILGIPLSLVVLYSVFCGRNYIYNDEDDKKTYNEATMKNDNIEDIELENGDEYYQGGVYHDKSRYEDDTYSRKRVDYYDDDKDGFNN